MAVNFQDVKDKLNRYDAIEDARQAIDSATSHLTSIVKRIDDLQAIHTKVSAVALDQFDADKVYSYFGGQQTYAFRLFNVKCKGLLDMDARVFVEHPLCSYDWVIAMLEACLPNLHAQLAEAEAAVENREENLNYLLNGGG